MNQRFYKTERLKSRKQIEALFKTGEKITFFPVKLIYIINTNPNAKSHQAAFSVPKKNFKKAVPRNKIKRRLREAYRKNKHLLTVPEPVKLCLMFIFMDKNDCHYKEIEQKVQLILQRLNQKFLNTGL